MVYSALVERFNPCPVVRYVRVRLADIAEILYYGA